jgi:hypothetical protein
MSSKIAELLNEYRLYDPEKENGCDTFERCEYLLNSRFDALLGFRIKDLKLNSRTLNNFRKELFELKELKIEEYRNKYIFLRAQEIPQIPQIGQIPEWMNGWIINIDKLYDEFETYEPYHENNCRTFETCKFLLNSRYRSIIEWKKAKYADILIEQSNKKNPIYKYYSDKFEKDLQQLKELKIEEYRTKFDSETHIETDIYPKTQTPYNIFLKEQLEIIKEKEKELSRDEYMTAKEKMNYVAYLWNATKKDNSETDIYPRSNSSQEYKKNDKGAQMYLEESIREHKKKIEKQEYRRLQQQKYKGSQIYLEKSIREHKEKIEKQEYQRLQQQEYEETKKKIQEQLHSLVKMPSRLFGRLMSLSSKKDDTKVKINIWSDKIIEMISDLSAWRSDKCENLDECIEKITIIIDIINSFVERPNTMINQEFSISSHTNNNYNIQKNKIYENFLYDYKITFTDKELQQPEYLKLLEDYKKIIIVLQNMKLDDCKNTFSKEKTGGNKHKKIKSKTDLKKKRK